MSTKRFATVALVIGLVGIAFEITQVVLYDSHLSMEWCYPASAWNYLAFFTVITNLLVDLWLITVGVCVLCKFSKVYKFLTAPAIQGAIVLYIATVSIIYCVFLFWFIGAYSLTLWWANIIDMWNHLILPVTMIVLWFTVPHKEKLQWSTLLYWLVFPFVYFVLSEIRGLIFDWYPYPFFRPSWVMFPLGIFITTACFLGVGAVIIWLHNKKAKSCKTVANKL
ncbi:MAG: Pr6Pr family membrane protein [Christensenellaceae bacterium]|jgi:hypothetical protein|nr:Pr6Pr family membrane protein [Christensenellaceae bacterium]